MYTHNIKQINNILICVDTLWHRQWANWFKRYCATSALSIHVCIHTENNIIRAWIDDLLDICDVYGGFDDNSVNIGFEIKGGC